MPLSPPAPTAVETPRPSPAPAANRGRVAIAVAALLGLHAALAVHSLLRENPTVDEVVHLPAGITYWQTGKFRLYHHNPPLVKLVAAIPVIGRKPVVDYRRPWWTQTPPNKAVFAHEFQRDNARRYFELFTRARLIMPVFSVIGGLVVFAWSGKLYGPAGGVLSLALWVFCPNVLAHARLVTTDAGATVLGALATFVFWLALRNPSWRLDALAGLCLGLAQLSKFSMLVLYGLWPLLAVVRLVTSSGPRKLVVRAAAKGPLIVAVSVLVIDLGYGFEGVGIPLGRHEFVCQTLTTPTPPGMRRPRNPDPLLDAAWRFRVNRFRGTTLGLLPVPLPEHYLLGFDDQKLEAEGIPLKFLRNLPPGAEGDELQGYPVYLDGVLRQKSWWDYYLRTLVYKVPEGSWVLVVGSLVVLAVSPRSRAPWFDEFAVLTVPVFVLFAMSMYTNINLGLRYVLPIFPFVYVSAGKLAPWALGMAGKGRRSAAVAFVGLGLAATAAATATIHPHYLAYFNAVSGGPARGSKHLIDSNLDWGQDLVNLRRWLSANAPGERVGLAYFGQIHPRIFQEQGEGVDWFLPPPLPGTMADDLPPRYRYGGPEELRLKPGLYAVSASLLMGLPWRVYDSPWRGFGQDRWLPFRAGRDAFVYFRELTPVATVGHSIFVYRVTPQDSTRLAHHWNGP